MTLLALFEKTPSKLNVHYKRVTSYDEIPIYRGKYDDQSGI